jgi:preprotein translocase subunit SecY
MVLAQISRFLPSVTKPTKRLGFKEKLKWTGIALIVFFILGEVPLYGLMKGAMGGNIFGDLQTIMASSFGTLMTLGIGPIVMASIVLQLLTGAGVFNFDMSTPEGKVRYQSAQKVMAIAFTLFEALLLVLSGELPLIAPGGGMYTLLLMQLMLGGILIIYLDEIVSKWGFGSGIGLFIAAGVSREIMVRGFDPTGTPINGAVPAFIKSMATGSVQFIRQYPNDMLAITATIVVFVVSMYAMSMKVEVPISYGRVRGLSRRYPLPFVYASNMPVILIAALLANVRFWIAILQRSGYTFLGYFDAAGMAHGPIYYILPYNQFAKDIILKAVGGPQLLHALCYFLVMVGGSVLFAKLWVGISGMDSKGLADRLVQSGMRIPGFRSDTRVIEKVLERYVPYITIMGGAFVGALAAGAEFTGALGGGTGVLLTVGIIYKLYEEIASEQLLEMHPAIRSFVGEGGLF